MENKIKKRFEIVLIMISACMSLHVMNAQWVRQNSGTTKALTDIVMLDSTTAIAVGHDNTILKTTNSGTTWNWIPLPISAIIKWNAVSFFDSKNGIVAGDNLVATTTDGGELWNFHQRPGKGNCISVLQLGPSNLYVGDDSGWVCHSLDTGRTWTCENISAWPIQSLFAWPGSYIMGIPIFALTSFSLFTKNDFFPGSWSETILPFYGLGSGAYSGEFCNGGGAGFIVGVHGDFVAAPTIVRKSISDSVWQTLSTGIPFGGTLFGVSAPSENVIYVCGSSGMMYKSMDGGDSWKSSPVPTTGSLSSVYFYNEDRGFAVGDSGLIFFSSNSTTGVDERENSLPLKFVLHQNYPNPFNPGTFIEFVLPSASIISLKVFNILGQEIETILNDHFSAGKHTVQWNASNFKSGIYFYRLQAGKVSLTKKMAVIK